MKRGIVLSALAALAISGAAWADYSMKRMGAWLVTASGDRFGDAGLYSAMVPMNGDYFLQMECRDKKLTLNLDPQGMALREDDTFFFKFRVDRRKLLSLVGEVKGQRIVIDQQNIRLLQLVRDIRSGAEVGIQMEGSRITEAVVRIDGADRALADIARNCPLD